MAEVVEREGYKVRLRVSLSSEEVERAFEEVLKQQRSRVQLPGFRPGKAPEKLLEARIGAEALREAAQEVLVDRSYPQAVRELTLSPVGARLVEKVLPARGEPFVYEVDVENYPEVELPDWKSFKLEAEIPEFTPELVERALNELRERYGEVQQVERPVEASDHVVLEFEDGGHIHLEVPRATEEVRNIVLGRSAGDQVILPGPDGSEVKAQIREVEEVTLPELDEDFAKTLGYDSLEETRAKLTEQLQEDLADRALLARKRELLEKLADGLEVEVPPSMLSRERRAVLTQLSEDLAEQGSSLSLLLGQMREGGKIEEFEADLEAEARRRIRRSLAAEKLAEQLEITLSEEEWTNSFREQARAQGMQPAEYRQALGQDGIVILRAQFTQEKALGEAVAQLTGETEN